MRIPLALALALPLVAACSSTVETPDLPDEIRVASDLDNPPFAYVDGDGDPAGRDVEMMRRLARRLGCRIEWVRMPFEELLPAVERGEVDVVCATLGLAPDRAARVLFTESYFETVRAVVVRAGAGEPRTLADLAERRVAAGAGTTSERAARVRLAESVLVLENEEGLDSATRLASGAVDAVVMDGPAATALVREAGGSLRLLKENLGAERYALALPRDRRALRERLDRALAALGDELAKLDREHGLR